MVRAMAPRTNQLYLLAALAILVPGCLLSYLQYKSLAELESQTRFAFRERLRQQLEAAVTRLESRLIDQSRNALSALDRQDLETDRGPDATGKLVAIRHMFAGVAHAFVYSQSGAPFAISVRDYESARLQGWRLNEPPIRRILAAYREARAAPSAPDLFFFHAADALFVFLPFSNASSRQQSDFAGVVWSRDAIAGMLAATTVGGDLPGMRAGIAEGGQGDISLPMGRIMPLWTAVGRVDGSIETLARNQFLRNLALSAVVMLCLLAASAGAFRLAAQEMKLARMKSAFVSNVSHEIRTPLALIRMFSETLVLGRVRSEERAAEYHQTIYHESIRLSQVIDNMLDFARFEAGKKKFEMRLVNAGDVLEEAVAAREHLLRSAGFEWTVNTADSISETAADPAALMQAILNLLDNAMKYSGLRKRITLSTEQRGDWVAISVADEGIGIPLSERDRIFEMFHRVNDSVGESADGMRHDTKGSGLGLALVKRIIAAHSGSIEVESEMGKGSRFTILLPAVTAQAKTKAAEDQDYDRASAEIADR